MKNIGDHFSIPTLTKTHCPQRFDTEELLDLQYLEGQRLPRLEDLQGFALNSKGRELKKAIERVGRGDVGDLRSGLQKLLGRRRIKRRYWGGGGKHVNL